MSRFVRRFEWETFMPVVVVFPLTMQDLDIRI